MQNSEAQYRAIKMSDADRSAEEKSHMDAEGRVHKCPSCGHEMPVSEVVGHAGAEKLTQGDKHGVGGAHMDHEGRV